MKDVLQNVCTVIFEVDSGSEFGDLLSSEEEMIDAGCDPEVNLAVVRYVQGLALLFWCMIHNYC